MTKSDTKLRENGPEEVTFDEFPRLVRHLLAALLAGLAIAATIWGSSVVALAITALMLVILPLRIRLTLNVRRRTYIMERGFSMQEGTFADIRGILLDRRLVQGESTVQESYMVSLLWVGGLDAGWEISHRTTLEGASADARSASRHLSLPILEGDRLVAYRAEMEAPRKIS